jgi:hypothetical protein
VTIDFKRRPTVNGVLVELVGHAHIETPDHNHNAAYAALAHGHDDRYYTEDEIDALLSGKSSLVHTHALAALSDTTLASPQDSQVLVYDAAGAKWFNRDMSFLGLLTQTLADARYAALAHLHDDRYYTEAEIDTLLTSYDVIGHNHDAAYAALAHLHDDRYYTESEIDDLLTDYGGHTHSYVALADYEDADVLAKLLNVDGPASGLYAAGAVALVGAAKVDSTVAPMGVGAFGGLGVAHAFYHSSGTGYPATAGVGFEVGRSANSTASETGSFRFWHANAATLDLYLAVFDGTARAWSSYAKLWHDGNDGAESGLDADLLDTYEAAAFGRLAASNVWTQTNRYNNIVQVSRGDATVQSSFNAGAFVGLSIEAFNADNSAKLPIALNGWGGYVGINNVNPVYALDATGGIRARSSVTAKQTGTYGAIGLIGGSPTLCGYIEWRLPAADGAAASRLGYIGWHGNDVQMTLENSARFVVIGASGVGGSIHAASTTGSGVPSFTLGNATRYWDTRVDGSTGIWRLRDISAGNLERLSVDLSGNLGVGTAAPQGRLHSWDGYGGMLHKTVTGVGTTEVQIIPDGTGDVAGGMSVHYVARGANGTTEGGHYEIANSGMDTSSVTTNLLITLYASGRVTVQARTSTTTWRISFHILWT